MHSVLQPASESAHLVRSLSWWLFGVAATVCVIVIVALVVAHGRRRETEPRPDALDDRTPGWWVAMSALATTAILVAFFVADLAVTRREMMQTQPAVIVEITGHQWWWELTYDPADPARRFSTANELHLPVGQPVEIRLRTADVIHSFWVPALAGKQDLIPGHPATLRLIADSAGVYRGQCSQFCGLQHAHMALWAVAEPAADFERWRMRQRQAAVQPVDSLAARGRSVFQSGRCMSCHAINGVIDVGRYGPDLTHVASRQTIAAGTLSNTADHLAAWITDPSRFKPGANMPANPLSPADLRALVAYLGSLQ